MNMQSPLVPHYGDEGGDVIYDYMEIISIVDRLHRQLLGVIRHNFERVALYEINSIQGLLLFNIGSQTVTASDLTSRGHYQGSNVSYNLRKLTELGFVECERSTADRRSVRVRLTEKGVDVHSIVASLFQRHARDLAASNRLQPRGIEKMKRDLGLVERYWTEQLRAVF